MIKEREQAIQLLAMDPQVCGKLLTHHRRGNKVVDSPSHRVPEKASRWDLAITDTCGGEKSVLGGSLLVSWFLRIYRGRIRLNRETRGPQGTRARAGGSWPPPLSSDFLPKLLVPLMSRKKPSKSFMAFGLCLVVISQKTKNRQKNWHSALSQQVSPRK